jgi:hypothetical protein
MHPRPRTAKRARVSFDPDLDVVTESLTIEGGLATGHQGGGWGGHWQTRTEMPQLTTGKGKEAMEPPLTKSKRPLEALSASFSLHPGHDVAVETTTCHFCRRANLWLYLTCGVCQLTTHANCYYRLGSDEAAYYEKNSSNWRCQDCGGPQRHADCALSDNGQVVQQHVGSRLPSSGYHVLGDGDVVAGTHQSLRSDCVLSTAMEDPSMLSHPPTTDVMLIDQNLSDQDMTSNTPKKRRTKTKKSGSLNHGGHSTQHRKHFQKQGSVSLQKEMTHQDQDP